MINPSDITSAPAAALVDHRYLEAASDSLTAHGKLLKSLIAQRRLLDKGVAVPVIEALLGQISLMDSNNFPNHAGAGEREGRVFSSIVSRRHFHMAHGIGRSGDLTADQPKAAGSSLMAKLANAMSRDALHGVGLSAVEKSIVVPSCTGMTLALVLQYVRSQRPDTAKFVIWPRIDQKTCLKCIEAAGLIPVVVELRKEEHEQNTNATAAASSSSSLFLRVHPEDVAAAIAKVGPENIVCVLSTTSCFAPRLPDDPLALGRVCIAASPTSPIPLVVNNAYGVQSPAICRRLNACFTECGKKVAVSCVQSCDKNFLVPVGGSVLAGSANFVDSVAALYAGRASAGPSTDMFVTLLEMGRAGWLEIQQRRQELLPVFKQRALEFAVKRGETLIASDVNDISFAVTLANFGKSTGGKSATWLGGALFRSGISGPRILEPPTTAEAAKTSKVGKTSFSNYGMHGHDHTAPPMLVMACAVGVTMEDIDGVMRRLESLYPVIAAPAASASSDATTVSAPVAAAAAAAAA